MIKFKSAYNFTTNNLILNRTYFTTPSNKSSLLLNTLRRRQTTERLRFFDTNFSKEYYGTKLKEDSNRKFVSPLSFFRKQHSNSQIQTSQLESELSDSLKQAPIRKNLRNSVTPVTKTIEEYWKDSTSVPVLEDKIAKKRLFEAAWEEKKILAVAILLLLFSSGVSASIPYSIGTIMDSITAVPQKQIFGLTSKQFFVTLSILFTTAAVSNVARIYFMRLAAERLIMNLRVKLHKSLIHQDIRFFDENRVGELISRLSMDTALVGKTLTINVADGLRNFTFACVGFGMMGYISPYLTGCMMCIVPPVAIAGVYYGRYVKNLSRQTQTAFGDLTKVAEEKLSNVRTVQAFSNQDVEVDLYSKKAGVIFNLAMREATANGVFFGMAGLSGNLTVVAVLALGGNMVAEGLISVGELTSFLIYTVYVGSSLSGLSSFYSEIMKGIGASSRFFSFMERKPEIDSNAGLIPQKPLKFEIEFDKIHFHYPTRPHAPIFNGLTFKIQPGQMVAFAGPSGGGKSTIGSLLLRFYDPTSGNIRIGNQYDLKDLNPQWWRNQIGVVSQEPPLFAGTILENITYGKHDATFEDVIRASKMANCYNFIQSLPNKFDTMVGERGMSMSGGQKQRIALARAFILEPKILLLDEATSALDSTSEKLVQSTLETLSRKETNESPIVITIAHRLSTLKLADIIFVIENGVIVEYGTYQELLNNPDSKFAILVADQQNS